ncbi:MAG TPA: hypothetical protein VGK43_06545 [Solirubrobacterales bacterium]
MRSLSPYAKAFAALISGLVGWGLTRYVPDMDGETRAVVVTSLATLAVYYVPNRPPGEP